MDTIRLIHTQLELECIGFDQEGLLVRIPGSNPDDMARVYAFEHGGGHLVYFRHDVPAAIREQIRALGTDVAVRAPETVRAILAKDSCSAKTFMGQTYVFPGQLDPRQFPAAIRLTEAHRPLIETYDAGMDVSSAAVYAVIKDGMIVSTCRSSRENSKAGEAYVYTLAGYRRRGYGRQTTAAWAHHLQQEGKIAFYSHARDNVASRGVAHSLGLTPCFACVNYS